MLMGLLIVLFGINSALAAEPPPLSEHKPFSVPPFDGTKRMIHPPAKPEAAQSPGIDTKQLFRVVQECWPVRSHFRAELHAVARIRTGHSTGFDETGFMESGRSYAGIQARIPLYSAIEIDRERDREATRRVRSADAIGALVLAVADMRRIRRELDLMRALEARAQKRAEIGVADTAEQLRYVEKVSELEGGIIKQRAAITKSRLELLSLCAEDKSDLVDAYIDQYAGRVR